MKIIVLAITLSFASCWIGEKPEEQIKDYDQKMLLLNDTLRKEIARGAFTMGWLAGATSAMKLVKVDSLNQETIETKRIIDSLDYNKKFQ